MAGNTLVLSPCQTQLQSGAVFASLISGLSIDRSSRAQLSDIVSHSTPCRSQKTEKAEYKNLNPANRFRKPNKPAVGGAKTSKVAKNGNWKKNQVQARQNQHQPSSNVDGYSSGSSSSISPVNTILTETSPVMDRQRKGCMSEPHKNSSSGNSSYGMAKRNQHDKHFTSKYSTPKATAKKDRQGLQCGGQPRVSRPLTKTKRDPSPQQMKSNTAMNSEAKLPSAMILQQSSTCDYKPNQADHQQYIQSTNRNDERPVYKDISSWGQSNTANKYNSKTSNNTRTVYTNRDHNSSLNTCQSDSNSSTKNNNSAAQQAGNGSDGHPTTSQNRSFIRVATLHETSDDAKDSYTKSLNDYNSNSKTKATSVTIKNNFMKGQGTHNNNNNQRNRNRNSNSFSKSKNYKPAIENSRFAGYAASPDPTTLPQPPMKWLTQSINFKRTNSGSTCGSDGAVSSDGQGAQSPLPLDSSLSENDARLKNTAKNKRLFANFSAQDLPNYSS